MMVFGHLGLTMLPLLLNRETHWDVRLLVLGAFLPDIIDKPIGHLLLPQNNGRIIGHTLLFAISLVLFSAFFRKMAPLAFGVAFHQLLDGVFTDPQGALWPLMGGFETTSYEVSQWLLAYTKPWVLFEEAAGLVVLLLVINSFGLKNILKVIRHGHLKGQQTIYN